MDDIDRKILDTLQRDSSLSLAEIARRVGLSTTPCWRRIQNLDRDGVITDRVALLNPAALNVGTMVFVRIRTSDHSANWVSEFTDAVEQIPEVVGFYRLSGDVDYLLQLVVPDIAGYDAVYKRLVAKIGIDDVSASFVMETIKSTTALPLHYAG